MPSYQEAKEYFEEQLEDNNFKAAEVMARMYLRSIELSDALEGMMKACQWWNGFGQASWWLRAVKAMGQGSWET